MPVKERSTMEKGLVPSASLQTITIDQRRWKPSCNKPQSNVVTSSLVERVSTDVPVDRYISGERINYRNSRKKRFNYCSHVRSLQDSFSTHLEFLAQSVYEQEEVPPGEWPSYSCANSQFIWQKTVSNQTLRIQCGSFLDLEADIESVNSDSLMGSDFVHSKLDFLARSAIDEMTPKLDDGFSAPVFIADLLELRGLARAARSLWEATTDVLWASIGGGTIKDISSTYLAHQFGLKPLVSDVQKCIIKFNSANDKILRLIENENKSMTLHYEKKLAATDLLDPVLFIPTPQSVVFEKSSVSHPWYFARDVIPNSFSLVGTRTLEVTDLEYHATMRFKYSLPNYSQAMKAFLASLDHWGVNVSVSDIWEIIPFSFLLDWVFGVGDWLEGFDFENLPVTVHIEDFCDSVIYKRKDSYTIDSVSPTQWQPLTTTLSRTKECYYRWPGYPPGAKTGAKWEEVNSRHNGAWRLSILASLVGARSRYYF